jgi:signal peptidase I
MNKILAVVLIVLGCAGLVYQIFYVTPLAYTGSMEPNFSGGDRVFVSPFLPENLTGKVVTYRVTEDSMFYGKADLICHRVIADYGAYVVTKGDANTINDGYVSKSEIVGWVYFKTESSVSLLIFSVPFFMACLPLVFYLVKKYGAEEIETK